MRVTWNGALGKWDATGEPLMGCSFMIRRALVWMEGVVPLDSHEILKNTKRGKNTREFRRAHKVSNYMSAA